MVKSTLLSAACLAGALAIATTAVADEFHYNNILIGDRASGMGGAYTAVSDDPSGMYYNPAGIVYSTGKNLSASVNAYNVSNRTYKGVIGGADWTRKSSYLLPNFFGIIQPIGKFKVGFSYAVPDSNQEDQDQVFNYGISGWGNSTHVINFNNKNDTNLFGPTVAVPLNDKVSVGVTLYAHKRDTEAISNQSIQSDDGTKFFWANNYQETEEYGLRPVVGVMVTPVEKLSLGLSVSKTYILSSTVLTQSTASTNVAGLNNGSPFTRSNPPAAGQDLLEASDKRTYPYQVSGGIAYFPNPSLLISADVSYFSRHSYTLAGREVVMDPVVNGALGVEYYLNKNWAMRGGLFTDFSNTPKLVDSGPAFDGGQFEHIDLYGGSLTVSHFSRNTSISGGGSYKFGTGRSQVQGGGTPVQDADASSWTVFVSSSYSY